MVTTSAATGDVLLMAAHRLGSGRQRPRMHEQLRESRTYSVHLGVEQSDRLALWKHRLERKLQIGPLGDSEVRGGHGEFGRFDPEVRAQPGHERRLRPIRGLGHRAHEVSEHRGKLPHRRWRLGHRRDATTERHPPAGITDAGTRTESA